ncbi:MAG: aminotransferase class V-fold PLP-dependent enzyme [Planctomycetota bacterium]
MDSQSPENVDQLTTAPWHWWRRNMPVAKEWAYLDHAAVGPLSRPAAEAVRFFAAQAETQGDTVWPQWSKKLESLRSGFAELLGASNDEIALIPNTSSGINLVAEGFPWKSGDNVILPEGEFPSNLFPWQNQAPKGVEVRIVPRRGTAVVVEDLLDQIDDCTRMIALSWVGYASGYRVEIEKLVDAAHQRGVLVFLDAIQGLGVFDLNVSKIPIDFLAADGHKWLLGPEGLGVAFIRHQHLDLLRVSNVGWCSVKNTFNYNDPQLELKPTASRFEPGSANMMGAAALEASLRMFLDVRRAHGTDAIANRVVGLASQLADRLRDVGARTELPEAGHRSGIVQFALPGVPASEFRNRAIEAGCVLSCRGGGVRASIHAYNDESDIERIIDVASSFASVSPNATS